MTTNTQQEKLRVSIGRRVRQLRQDRRWTQTQLAELLGLSQNRLSEIELGKGSFAAEQLLTILKTFNVSLDYFSPPAIDRTSELQNALARLGASQLAESQDILPTDKLKEAADVIKETLAAAASPRQLAALAPVLVAHIDNLNLAKLRQDLSGVGLSQRLGWVVENTVEALEKALRLAPSKPWARKYLRAHTILATFLSHFWSTTEDKRREGAGKEDSLDPGIATEKTFVEVLQSRSPISKRWRIVSRIEPGDFLDALRDTHGAH